MALLWDRGKRAMRSAHRTLVADDPQRSVDLDSQLASDYPNDARWDYILEGRSKRRRGAAVEVHDGDIGQIDLMWRKKEWAAQVLGEIEPDLTVERWHWVVPPGSRFQFPATSRAARQLAAAGIERPCRRVEAQRLLP